MNKVISKLKVGDDLVTDPHKILEEEKKFYKDLYSENISHTETEVTDATNFFLEDNDLPKVDEECKNKCEALITEAELLRGVKAMKKNKSPGSDGLTSEFYQFFWIDIKHILLASLNYALQNGKLSTDQKRGIISLLPKKDKDRLYLKNWRPISLLNIDYKILTKILANRILKSLPSLIDDDQTGYLKGRYIGSNIRIIEDIIIYTRKNNISGILLSIDFEKAFDSIRWSFIDKCLEAFNFGPHFRKYITTLYHDITTAVMNNGHMSDWFSLGRGVRQGCPISPYLFILCVEVLARKIRQDPSIKGISICNTEIKLSQLADDTTTFVKDIGSLKNLLYTLSRFEVCSGLKTNVSKTTAVSLGPFKPDGNKQLGLDWSNNSAFTLGLFITGEEKDHYELNFKPRITKLRTLLRMWNVRGLSLKGKVTVLNSLALTPLIYAASTIHVPERVVQEVKSIVVDFLWGGKTSKIAYNVLIQEIRRGGLKLVDFESKVKSLKASWVNRLLHEGEGRWKAASKYFLNIADIVLFFKYNNHKLDNSTPLFYTEIMAAWSELHSKHNPSLEVIKHQTLWNNKYITINKQSFFWNTWAEKDILHIADLLNEHGTFLSHTEIQSKYNVQCNFLNILQLRQSIPIAWRERLKSCQDNILKTRGVFFIQNNEVIKIANSETKNFYWYFINNKMQTPSCIKKWNSIFPYISEGDILKSFKLPFKCIRETKVQSLQYRILHRTITCNKKLADMKLIESNKCNYCTNEDDILHFFIFCPAVYHFWKDLMQWFEPKLRKSLTFPIFPSPSDIIFGIHGEDHSSLLLNFFILHAKNYIHFRRLFKENSLSKTEFMNIIKYKIDIELAICEKNKRMKDFEKFRVVYPFL